ncbi:MAG: Bax inhibitor-1 family protein [Pirellulaceae bacterium]
MFGSSNPYAVSGSRDTVAYAAVSERTAFIQRTYVHLGGAVMAFVSLEAVLLSIIPAEKIFGLLRGGYSWLVVLALFMGVSWLANKWAHNGTSRGMQYAGLSLFVIAEALIFLPLMAIAFMKSPDLPLQAGILTAIIFGALTAMAFITKADFSWMGKVLMIVGFGAMAMIVVSIFAQFPLGVFFVGAMIVFASAYILYDTSNVIHHYRTDQHVAASLALFSSVALLFWYILQLLMSFSQD